MTRPTTKADLLKDSTQQFNNLWTTIDELSINQQEAAFHFTSVFLANKKEAHWKRDQNLRDVFIHLYEWHCLLLDWVKLNQQGEAVSFLPAPYNWRTYGELNQLFLSKHRNTSLLEAKERVTHSHQQVMKLIASFSNDELFSKNIFSWTGTSTLGSYCISATSSHYQWAIKKINAYKKTIIH